LAREPAASDATRDARLGHGSPLIKRGLSTSASPSAVMPSTVWIFAVGPRGLANIG
jgi:hypothetical protein